MNALATTREPRAAWWIALGCWLLLLALLVAWEAWLAPVRPGGSWLVLKAAPLLLPLRGMLRRNKDAMQWSLLIVLLYLIEGTVRVFEPTPYGTLAALEIALVCAFFAAAVAYLRPFKRAARVALSGDR